jgi:hypothetical protein
VTRSTASRSAAAAEPASGLRAFARAIASERDSGGCADQVPGRDRVDLRSERTQQGVDVDADIAHSVHRVPEQLTEPRGHSEGVELPAGGRQHCPVGEGVEPASAEPRDRPGALGAINFRRASGDRFWLPASDSSPKGLARGMALDIGPHEDLGRGAEMLSQQRHGKIGIPLQRGVQNLPMLTANEVNLVVGRLWEQQGDRVAALAAVRRRCYHWFLSSYLAVYLREEARLAAATGDRIGAERANQHYLALRGTTDGARPQSTPRPLR